MILIVVYSVGRISGLSPNDIEHWTLTPWKDFMGSTTYIGEINPLGTGLFWKSVRMSLTVVDQLRSSWRIPSPTCSR